MKDTRRESLFTEAQIIEPISQASLRRLRPAEGNDRGVLLFSNPASQNSRERMTLRASLDDGETWPSSALIDAGPAAYPCLAVLGDGSVLCLEQAACYEAGPYPSIRAHVVPPGELP